MDVWGSQHAAASEQPPREEEDWELAESGKDALIVLLDVRKAMFSPYPLAAAEAPSTWFHAVVELVIKLLKSKVVASDNSLLSVIFFGTVSGRSGAGRCQLTLIDSLFEPRTSAEKQAHWSKSTSFNRWDIRRRRGSRISKFVRIVATVYFLCIANCESHLPCSPRAS